MPRFKIEPTIGMVGRLLVLSHAGKDHRNKHLWLCRCDCGNEKQLFLTIYQAENQKVVDA